MPQFILGVKSHHELDVTMLHESIANSNSVIKVADDKITDNVLLERLPLEPECMRE